MEFTIWTKEGNRADGYHYYNECKITTSDKYKEAEAVMFVMALVRYINFRDIDFPVVEIHEKGISYKDVKKRW